MVRLLIITVLFSICSSLVMAASARVDRNQIQEQETLNLVLRVETNNPSGKPDLSELENNFHILSNSQSSRHMMTNGRTQSWTEWQITLMPKRTGKLYIPAIPIGNEKTLSVAINVDKASVSNQQNQSVFLESNLSHQQAYINQQVLFTVRIFNAVQLDGMSLTPPELEDASIQRVAQNNFYRSINGKRYQVTELTYAIFPEQTGEIIIPELIFSAEQRIRRDSHYSFNRGTPVRKLTPQHSIDVFPQPDNTLAKPWLPAQSVQLHEQWSNQSQALEVGQSITRTVQLTAVGALPQQLAAIQFEDMVGAKQYPDQGTTESSEGQNGITSTRQDSVAIIPTQAGPLTLPAIRVQWWDTEQNIMREAVLPEKTINVMPSSTIPSPTTTSNATSPTARSSHGNGPASSSVNNQTQLWQIISIVLALGWLSTLWRWRRFSTQSATVSKLPKNDTSVSESQAFKALEKSCKQQDKSAIRTALMDWGVCRWPNQTIHSLDDIIKAAGNDALREHIRSLSQSLYGKDCDQNWQPENLLSALNQVRKTADNKKGSQSFKDLPPLYKQ